MYSTLNFINDALGLLGELPVNDADSPHPQIPGIKAALRSRSISIQAVGWWFNTYTTTIVPQAGTGIIAVAPSILSIDATDPRVSVAHRGGRLFNLTDNTDRWTSPVEVVVKEYFEFEALPLLARFYIGASAKEDIVANLDADPAKVRKVSAERSESYQLFHAEHIRNSQGNMLTRPGFAYRLREIIGDSPFGERYVI